MLQMEYLAWATQVLESRKAAYGTHAPYELRRDMKVEPEIATTLFDATRKFLSSASRSPIAGALVTRLAPEYEPLFFTATGDFRGKGEFNNSYDPTVIGSGVAGATAYLVESTLLTAMDRVAAQANLAKFKKVSIDALFPDPCSVRLKLVKRGDATVKVFTRIDGAGVHAPSDEESANTTRSMETENPPEKSLESLSEEVAAKRKAAKVYQNLLDGEDLACLLQPMLAGATNVVRRFALSERDIESPWLVLSSSALASGTAGALAKLILGGAKAIPWAAQTTVDDLVGGKQRVNLFSTNPPNVEERSVRFSDIMKVPGYLWPVLRESLALLGHTFNWRFRPGLDTRNQAVDFIGKVSANMLAIPASTSIAPFASQLQRGGRVVADPNESSKAPAALGQQFVQSAASDLFWETFKACLSSGHNLGDSLDRRRNTRRRELGNQLEQLRQSIREELLPKPGTPVPEGQRQEVRQRLQTLLRATNIDVVTLRQLKNTLIRLRGENDAELVKLLRASAKVQGKIDGIDRARLLKRD